MADNKIRKYRIVAHNSEVNEQFVAEVAKSELGEDINVVKWGIERTINYKAGKDMPYLFGTPQRETIVTLEYQEISEEEIKQALKDKKIPLPPQRERPPLQSQIEQALKDKDIPLSPKRD